MLMDQNYTGYGNYYQNNTGNTHQPAPVTERISMDQLPGFITQNKILQ